MTTTNTAYENAIAYATTNYRQFAKQHERVQRRYGKGDGNTNFVRLMEQDERVYAAATQAQQRLIAELFGKTEDEVHADIVASEKLMAS